MKNKLVIFIKQKDNKNKVLTCIGGFRNNVVENLSSLKVLHNEKLLSRNYLKTLNSHTNIEFLSIYQKN